MRTWFDKLTIGLVIALSLPTSLVILTWNSLPGNFDYPIKLAMEKLLLVIVSPSYAASGNLNIAYTDRRYSEAKQLLAQKQSTTGLVLLANQVAATKATILGSKNQGEAQAQQLATRYIATLETVKSDLEEQKISLVASAPNLAPLQTTIVVHATPTLVKKTITEPTSRKPTPTRPPATPNAPTSTEPETTQEVVNNIDQTQEVIQQTIDELEKVRENQGNNRSDRGEQMSSQAPGQQNQPQGNNGSQNGNQDNSNGNNQNGNGNGQGNN